MVRSLTFFLFGGYVHCSLTVRERAKFLTSKLRGLLEICWSFITQKYMYYDINDILIVSKCKINKLIKIYLDAFSFCKEIIL